MNQRKIGITTTVPVEAIYAAGCVPVDLNNVFITSEDPYALVTEAEYQGYPRNSCGWIKGIYTLASTGNFESLVAVIEGDCSQTQAMVETLKLHGVKILPFAYPYGRDRDLLRLQIAKLIEAVGATWKQTIEWKLRLDDIRRKVWELDRLTWQVGTVSSFDNHYYQVCCSDFIGDPDAFEAEVDSKLAEARSSTPKQYKLRLGYVGVPPIFLDFYQYLEDLGIGIVFNEVQRQFSMPFETDDLVEQYAHYTYPYDIFSRIDDIRREVEKRDIQGLIHYTQSFCFRQIQDMIMRQKLSVPMLTLEGDAPSRLDARTKVRVESFLEMLT